MAGLTAWQKRRGVLAPDKAKKPAKAPSEGAKGKKAEK